MEQSTLKCANCGHESVPNDEVLYYHNYTGGIGYFWQPECKNRIKCSQRVDQTRKLERQMVKC
jgi:hypothetical protein